MHDRRLRLGLTALLGTITAILSTTPLVVWHHANDDAIRSRIRNEAVAQMAEVLRGEISGQRNEDYYSWYANVNDGYEEPFVESDLLPPVRNWIRDASGYSSFREYPVEGEDGYLAFVQPLDDNAGYVTLVSVTQQGQDLSSSSRRFWIISVLLLFGSYGLAFFVGGLALGPTRRLLGDQQGFLADAAHEMRTPLAVILASSSQALSRPRTTEEYVRSLAEIRSAAERAGSGINEMLDLVRLNTGQAIPRLAPLRLDLLAEEVAASVRPEGAVVVAEPSDPVVVDGDMALLRQAIDNLVRNAARRSERVELLTRIEGRDGVIDVVDNGPGFDPAVLPKVFDRYQRGDRRGDVGLGLAIVRAIAQAHGGTAVAANRESGGASVSIKIPLNRALSSP